MQKPSLLAVALGALAVISLGLVGNVATSTISLTPTGKILVWSLAALLALIVIAFEVYRQWLERRHHHSATAAPDDEGLAQAASALREAVRRQWTDEIATRGLRRPEPLRVRWSTTRRAQVAAYPEAIFGKQSLYRRITRPRLEGDLQNIVAKFRQLPFRQLVVLGEPGAGKSVLAIWLALGLLAESAQGDPVPVLLSISSWNPGDDSRRDGEQLRTWLSRRLEQDYPFLLNTERYGADAAWRLVTNHKVLPIFDGVDEIPPARRVAAIKGIDETYGAQPFVVTSRTGEYQAAVETGRRILSTAAVIELQPVDLNDVARFLTSTPPEAAHWQLTLATLRDHPNLPLARALSSPLMVALARGVYTEPATDPAAMLDTNRFADQVMIERHLLDAFVPAAYAASPSPPPRPPRRSSPARWRPERANAWLGFLANRMHAAATHDLAWWRLEDAVPRYVFAVVFGLAGGFMGAVGGAIAGWITEGPASGWLHALIDGVAGVVAGGVGGWIIAVAGGAAPSAVRFRLRGRVRPFRRRLASGFAFGLVVVAVGTFMASAVKALKHSGSLDVTSLYREGTPELIAAGLAIGLAFSLVMGAGAWLGAPTEAVDSVSPVSLLRMDRDVALAHAVIVGPMVGTVGGFAIGQADGHVFGVAAGFAIGLIGGLMAMARTSWGRFVIARGWLGGRYRLPWRLMAFLDDAHQRGLLRQAGAAYQFRHARLRDHLIAAARRSSRTGPNTGRDDRSPV